MPILKHCKHEYEPYSFILHYWQEDVIEVNAFNLRESLGVAAKTATPTKVDSKLSDAHLESLKSREGERECH
jgi:hypothetical protein